mgnify:FL=1|jgi:hypothetical protein
MEVKVYKHKIDLNTVHTFGSYGCNLYTQDGEFVEARVFNMISGQMFHNEIREIAQFEKLRVESLAY